MSPTVKHWQPNRNNQETQHIGYKTNRTMDLCKCNGVGDLIKTPLPHAEFGPSVLKRTENPQN